MQGDHPGWGGVLDAVVRDAAITSDGDLLLVDSPGIPMADLQSVILREIIREGGPVIIQSGTAITWTALQAAWECGRLDDVAWYDHPGIHEQADSDTRHTGLRFSPFQAGSPQDQARFLASLVRHADTVPIEINAREREAAADLASRLLDGVSLTPNLRIADIVSAIEANPTPMQEVIAGWKSELPDALRKNPERIVDFVNATLLSFTPSLAHLDPREGDRPVSIEDLIDRNAIIIIPGEEPGAEPLHYDIYMREALINAVSRMPRPGRPLTLCLGMGSWIYRLAHDSVPGLARDGMRNPDIRLLGMIWSIDGHVQAGLERHFAAMILAPHHGSVARATPPHYSGCLRHVDEQRDDQMFTFSLWPERLGWNMTLPANQFREAAC